MLDSTLKHLNLPWNEIVFRLRFKIETHRKQGTHTMIHTRTLHLGPPHMHFILRSHSLSDKCSMWYVPEATENWNCLLLRLLSDAMLKWPLTFMFQHQGTTMKYYQRFSISINYMVQKISPGSNMFRWNSSLHPLQSQQTWKVLSKIHLHYYVSRNI